MEANLRTVDEQQFIIVHEMKGLPRCYKSLVITTVDVSKGFSAVAVSRKRVKIFLRAEYLKLRLDHRREKKKRKRKGRKERMKKRKL